LLLFHTSWGKTNVQKGHVSTFTNVECCKRLCAVSHQVLQLVLATHVHFQYELLVLWHSIITYDVGRFSLTSHHVLQQWNLQGCNIASWWLVCYGLPACTLSRRVCLYCKIALLFEVMILTFWCLLYYWSKDLISGFAYMLAGHNTSTVNVTFLHPFHCCRTWCRVLRKSPYSTCTYRMSQYNQFKSNRKMCRLP
jgi:hypothetical protein